VRLHLRPPRAVFRGIFSRDTVGLGGNDSRCLIRRPQRLEQPPRPWDSLSLKGQPRHAQRATAAHPSVGAKAVVDNSA